MQEEKGKCYSGVNGDRYGPLKCYELARSSFGEHERTHTDGLSSSKGLQRGKKGFGALAY